MLTGDHIKAALKAAGAGSGLVMPADIIADSFNDAMTLYGGGLFNTPAKVAALVSECMMESAYFRTSEEYAKNGRYAPYIGRTFMQLTWQTNYAKFGAWCHSLGLLDDPAYFVDHPVRLADLKWATLGGVFYFTQVKFAKGPLTEYATDILAVGRAVNMGSPTSTKTPAGQSARAAAYKAVLALGPAIVPGTPTPTPDPTPTPGDDVPVNLRGFKVCSCVAEAFPALEQEMLRRGLIKHSIDIAQGGYNSGGVKASSGTHDKGGCIDILQYSDDQIRCARDMGWTFQHRTPAQGFAHHAHGWPLGCDHLSPAAQSQATQWRNGTNGLVSRGRIAGKYPIDDWKAALKKWKAAEKKRADDAAAAAKKKELEMPTVKELTQDKDFLAAIADAVLNSDTIPNNGLTSNAANATVSPKTALSQLGKKSNDIAAKLDALAAAVAAAFPEPTDPAPPAA